MISYRSSLVNESLLKELLHHLVDRSESSHFAHAFLLKNATTASQKHQCKPRSPLFEIREGIAMEAAQQLRARQGFFQ